VPEKLESAMSKFPQAKQAKTFTPAWMKTARAWYGSAFEPKKKGDLAESMSDWSEMDPAERGFVLAHLQYLGLQAQLGTQRMLRELRALFEEVGDEVIEVLEGVADAVEQEDQGEADADAEADADDQVVDAGEAGTDPEERRLELVEDTPIPDYEPEPRVMPVEAVAPEMLRGADDENVIDLPGLVEDDPDDEPPEGA
jgi:hypothetical protein